MKTIYEEPLSCETCYMMTNFDDEPRTYLYNQSIAVGVVERGYVSIMASSMPKEGRGNNFIHLLFGREELDDLIRGLKEARIKMDTITDEEIKRYK